MLQLENVSFKYPNESKNIIENLNFQCLSGEFVSIVGASGCGKSTIFRLINGIETAYTGSICVDNKDIRTLHHYCSFMPQKDLLLPNRTIYGNLSLPLEIRKDKNRREKILNMLEQIGLLEYEKKYAKDLSGGMKQRVSFGRALLNESDLLLLDEPFSALDYLTKINMQLWLLSQWEKNPKTVLFITHDIEEAIFLSSKIFVIEEKPVLSLKLFENKAPYPRTRELLNHPDVVALKENLIHLLSKKEGLL